MDEARTGTSVRITVVLGMLSTFGPLSLDLYLPALPELADELHASASASQLSITTCLLGLAVGQLAAGPLSDRLGRRRPLMIGLVLYMLTSAACAFAPSIWLLLVLRLLQGLSGAAGIVIARAMARDLYSGRALVVFFARLQLVSGLAPVIAPVLGGQLVKVMSWRGVFGVLTALGAVIVASAWFGLPESLPAERRLRRGLRSTLGGFATLVRDRFFMGAGLSSGLASASMFAYIAGATFVLQRLYHLSPQGFSFVFGSNSIGLMLTAQLGGRLVRRFAPGRLLAAGLATNTAGSIGVLTAMLGGLGVRALVVSLFVMVASLGLVFPNAMALALADHGAQAGTASSLLGLGQYAVGALVAPLVGVAGEATGVPMGVVAVCASVAAVVMFSTFVRRRAFAAEPDLATG